MFVRLTIGRVCLMANTKYQWLSWSLRENGKVRYRQVWYGGPNRGWYKGTL